MTKIRILAVDDSVLIRRFLTDVLSEDPNFEVMAAASGKIALDRISLSRPDLILLDVEMPDMDGLETLKAIRRDYPKLPVIMFSRLTERGASTTIDALFIGANDYVTKPTKVKGPEEAKQRIREELIPKIKALCLGKLGSGGNRFQTKRPVSPVKCPLVRPVSKRTSVRQKRMGIVAIGVSTGGPNALARVLSDFPANFPVPIVIVQHLPAVFSKYLAERLTAKTPIRVKEADSGDQLKPGHAFLAPGGFHITLEKSGAMVHIQTNQGPPVNNCRPSVDVLFQSVVKVYGAYTLGVILTGMGYDGLKGCELIKKSGGQVLAQDKASSSVWGMPGAVAEAGLADRVLPLNQVGNEIVNRIMNGEL